MKKFMFAAMAALAITSCSQNEEMDAPSQKTAIGFSTMVSKTTRAAITDDKALQESGFKVSAYTSKDQIENSTFPTSFKDLISSAEVTHSAVGGWESGEYYWPLTDKVHFYAYATDAAVANYVAPTDDGKYPTLSYTVADIAAGQKDFVVAKLENQVKSASAIALPFTHALTQVNFSAVGDKAGFTYTVNSIEIVNVAKTGTYSFAGTGTWTAAAEVAASYEYPINEDKKVIQGTTANALDITTNTLMLMPQAMNADAKIMVSYSVSNTLGSVYETPEGGISIPLTGKTAWEPGKKVRYTLTLGNGAVSMKFDPKVDSWGDPEVNGQDNNPVK